MDLAIGLSLNVDTLIDELRPLYVLSHGSKYYIISEYNGKS